MVERCWLLETEQIIGSWLLVIKFIQPTTFN